MKAILTVISLIFASIIIITSEEQAMTMGRDEFVGPFSSWADLRRDYGAIGDGKADDTQAIQSALDDLRKEDRKKFVLYIPMGDYRITKTLVLLRETHNESKDISIVGEDPARTAIIWDGEAGGVMFDYGAWYSKVSRLTFDGKGKAKTAIVHGKRFVTYNEFSDIVIKDVEFGIEGGIMSEQGIAETAVLRCKFVRCSKAGISIQNFNSLDWFIWYSIFERCGVGITNIYGAGNFHVYESFFINSTDSDISIGNTGYFSFRNNTTIGSKMFFFAQNITASANITIQGNMIIETKETPIQVGNHGPVLLFDNTFKSRISPQVKVNPIAGFISVGNTFTVKEPIEAKKDFISIDDKIVDYDTVQVKIPDLPSAPSNYNRHIIDLPVGSSSDAIQQAINDAMKRKGQRPVIHFPAGEYAIDKTIIIPQGSDVQLIGDGVRTLLRWSGKEGDTLLKIIGQSHAVIRDLSISGSGVVDGLVIEGCDQPNAKIFIERGNVSSAKQVGILAEKIANIDISLHDFNHSDCDVGVKVIGTNAKTEGRFVIFSGASSNNRISYDVTDGGKLLARDIWYESGQFPQFISLTGKGTFTLHGAIAAVASKEGVMPIELDNFDGNFSLLTTILVGTNYVPATVLLKGDGENMNVLLLGTQFGIGENYFINQSPKAKFAILEPTMFTQGGGSKPLPNQGLTDKDFILNMLKQTREAKPSSFGTLSDNVTDLNIFGVIVNNARNCIVIR